MLPSLPSRVSAATMLSALPLFFFEYDNVGFEPYPVAVQNVFAAYVGWGRADWWVGMWRGWFLSLCVFVGGHGE